MAVLNESEEHILHSDGKRYFCDATGVEHEMRFNPRTGNWEYLQEISGKSIWARALNGLKIIIKRGGGDANKARPVEPAQRLSGKSLPDVPGAGDEWWQN